LNSEIMEAEHNKLGIASFILAMVGLILLIVSIIGFYYEIYFPFLFSSLTLGLSSVILGGHLYIRKDEDSYGLAGLALGVIVLLFSLFVSVILLLLATGPS
jgi:hypothetical protein